MNNTTNTHGTKTAKVTVVTYMHAVMKDTGSNRPFQERTAECEIENVGPAFFGDVDNYVISVINGQFDGFYAGGESAEEAAANLELKLMNASRLAFD